MFDSLHRRRFMQVAAGTVVATRWPDSPSRADTAELDKLLSYVDPILRPRMPALRDGQNALPLLEAAGKLVTELPDGEFELEDCFSSTKPDDARDRPISTWLDQNQRAVPLVEQAVARGKLEFSGGWKDEYTDRLMSLRRLSRFLQLWAQRLLLQGNAAESARIAALMSEAFRLVKIGGGVYVEYLVALVCESAAWSLMTRIAQSTHTDATTLRGTLAQLPPRDDALGGLRRAVQAEFLHFLLPLLVQTDGLDIPKTIRVFFGWNDELELFLPRQKYEAHCDKIARLLQGHPKAYDVIDTVKRASELYAGWIRDFDLPWPKHRVQADRIPLADLAAWPTQLSMSMLDNGDPDTVTDCQLATSREKLRCIANPLGKKLVDSCELDSVTMHRAALTNQARYDGTRLFLAICIVAREQGKLPAALNELVEMRALVSLPLDPFSSDPFHYSRDRQSLWSVGPDGQVSPDKGGDDNFDIEKHLWRLDGIQATQTPYWPLTIDP